MEQLMQIMGMDPIELFFLILLLMTKLQEKILDTEERKVTKRTNKLDSWGFQLGSWNILGFNYLSEHE